jgi:thioredoxin reductase
VEAALALAEQPGNEVRMSYRKDSFSRIKPANHERVHEALDGGMIDVLWSTTPREIRPDLVELIREGQDSVGLPADQVFVFIGGELPKPFLRAAGVEIETHFGAPR